MNDISKKRTFRSKIILFDITTTLIPIILCAIILGILMFTLLTGYIRNDIVFFIKETNNNFQNKTVLVEDTLLRIRNNKSISDYLTDIKDRSTSDVDYTEVETQFRQSVDLYSDKNTAKRDSPFLDKIYLYDHDGNAFKAFYNPPLQTLQLEYDKNYDMIYQDFLRSKEDVKFVVDGENINLLFTVYSDSMQNIGTLIFVINMSNVNEIMQQVDHYDHSFWYMFDGDGNTIVAHNADMITTEDKHQIINTYKQDAYEHKIENTNYLIYTERMNMDFNCAIGIPSNHLFTLLFNSIKSYVYIFSAIILLVLVFTVIFIRKLTKPLDEVASSIRLVGKGKFDIKMPEFTSREFAYISEVFNSMTDRINYLIKDVYEKQLIIKESELKFLQTQVNPHFMFNVLNTIALKAKMDNNDDVSKMISSFAGLIQASIYRTDKEKVPIKQELIYLEFYLYLQSYRFGDKLNYKIKYDDERLLELYVPKLAIQFIVENAVTHGIEPKFENGFVEVNIYAKNNCLFIEVKDDGVGFDSLEGRVELPLKTTNNKTDHNHVGLNNTYKIIQYFYGNDYGIDIYTKKNEGTIVTIQIPFDNGSNAEDDQHV
ncbi:sensor histidine kinase [Paenibacillus segetis]|uniref:Histidine kinase n=1 Tax=Paenibacillus segetis TaxID=1325360 RepID=A0ABQ1YK27_9BACL|nr:sensor histidine kinase [Paenibacillus segetis]GGH29104.1 histidine kinase [Paenibacillus segetis]